MRNLNLDQLQTLIAIADLGTFAAAAQALHLAPPTVSLHISELELRLGVDLVVRGRRRRRSRQRAARWFAVGVCCFPLPMVWQNRSGVAPQVGRGWSG